MSTINRIAVLGAGAWGTALANAAARAGREVVLWEFDQSQAQALIRDRVNTLYLPGVKFADQVTPVADIKAVSNCDAALLVVPAQAMRATAELLALHLKKDVPVISCAKGIERGTLCFMSQILRAALPHNPACALSGPSFAADVANGLPAAVTVAARNEWLAADLSRALASPVLRLYHSDDVIGVEIGGAAKNVIAIGAGIAAGCGLGQSAGAAFVARGFAELRRFGSALGGKPETLMGLSGLGDLVLTATSPQSRNFSYGAAIGKGATPDGKLAEGAFTAQALVELAQKNHVDMPIATAVRDVLDGKISVGEAVETLLARPLTSEE